jgi:hypothetical protein
MREVVIIDIVVIEFQSKSPTLLSRAQVLFTGYTTHLAVTTRCFLYRNIDGPICFSSPR